MTNARALALGAAAIAGAIFGGHLGVLIVVALVAIAATGEVLRLIRATGVRPASAIALLGTVGLLIMVYLEGERGPRLAPAVIAAVVGAVFIELLMRREREHVSRVLATTLVPVLTVGLLASYIVAIRGMSDGFRLTVVLIAMVVASEALPALALALRGEGGKVAFIPRMIAGEIGVFVVALIAGTVADDLFTWPVLLVLALLIGAAAPVGRMAAVMIERDLRSAAGLGRAPAAILVRVDGLLLAAPVFFYVFRALTR